MFTRFDLFMKNFREILPIISLRLVRAPIKKQLSRDDWLRLRPAESWKRDRLEKNLEDETGKRATVFSRQFVSFRRISVCDDIKVCF